MDHLSPEAQKRVGSSELKRRSYWPSLSRDGNLLTLRHPHRGGHKAKKSLASYVAKTLPGLKWNGTACRWEAPLTQELLAKVLAAFQAGGETQLNISENLTAEDTVTLTVEYQSSARFIRSNGQIVSIQRNGDEPRPPKAHISPDDASRYLESKGYGFDERASAWLDRPGTTFRRQRRQVFHRAAVL